jgi:D-3-phosphoglycerate dehydrogenase
MEHLVTDRKVVMEQKNTVKIADCDHESIDMERSVLKDICDPLPWLNCRTEDEVIEQCDDAAGLLIQYAPMPERVLRRLPELRVIVRYGVGVDTIDLKVAAELGIVVSNVPDYGTDEVSDHALALILTLSRKILQSNQLIRSGVWDFRAVRPVHRMQKQTLGIIGIGRIGGALARKAKAIGMNIIAYDPYSQASAMPDYITMTGLDALLAEADIVSVHCPLDDKTRNLIDGRRLGLMKKGAYLVNTARGSIVDEVALEKALADGSLAGAALDVFSKEPVGPDHPLLRHQNFICSPHMAWHSEVSAVELKRKAAEETRRVLMGEAPHYQVNRI